MTVRFDILLAVNPDQVARALFTLHFGSEYPGAEPALAVSRRQDGISEKDLFFGNTDPNLYRLMVRIRNI
jgi:hypothetical protein